MWFARNLWSVHWPRLMRWKRRLWRQVRAGRAGLSLERRRGGALGSREQPLARLLEHAHDEHRAWDCQQRHERSDSDEAHDGQQPSAQSSHQ